MAESRNAHINLDATNTLVIPTPKSLTIRLPLPKGLQHPIKYCFKEATSTQEGILQPDGTLNLAQVSRSGEVTLEVWCFGENSDPLSWEFDLGALQSSDVMHGIQSRLNNLGYNAGPVDGLIGAQTRAATKAFQSDEGLVVDGEPGKKTQQALSRAHGC